MLNFTQIPLRPLRLTQRRKPSRFRPRFDLLEDRRTPAIGLEASLVGANGMVQPADVVIVNTLYSDAPSAPAAAINIASSIGFFHPFCQLGFGGGDDSIPALAPPTPPPITTVELDLFLLPTPTAEPPIAQQRPSAAMPVLPLQTFPEIQPVAAIPISAPPTPLSPPIPGHEEQEPLFDRTEGAPADVPAVETPQRIETSPSLANESLAAVGAILSGIGFLYSRSSSRRHDMLLLPKR